MTSRDNQHPRLRASSAIFTPAVVNSQIFMEAVADKLQNQGVEQQSLQNDIECEIPLIDKKDIEERYELRDLLGEGATSEVYAAYDKKRKEEVAVKIVDSEKLKLNRSLLREIKVMKQLDHPNIIKLKNVCRTDENLYIIMELAEGEALFEMLVEKKTYTEADARALVKDILGAIAYLHSKDIAHRDIKPENILCSQSGKIKIVDFGFAANSDEGLVTPLGTLGYKAPELIKKETHSMSVDMWSLGVLTYILLCGFPPFFSCQAYRDDTDFLFNTPFWYFFNRETPDLENAILSGNHDFPEAFWKNVSSEAKSFVSGLLQIEAQKRMTAAQALKHVWITTVKTNSPKSSAPLLTSVGANGDANNMRAVTEILRATSYASLARRSLNIQSLLGSESPHNRGLSLGPNAFNNLSQPVRKRMSVPSHVLSGRLTQSVNNISESAEDTEEEDNNNENPISVEGEMLGTPIRSGWIEIKGLSVFTKRWAMIYNGVLCYYKSDKDDPTDFFGVINLAGVKVYHKDHQFIEIIHPQKKPIFSTKAPGTKKKLPAVVLHHRQSHAVLKVPVEEELDWLSDLQKAIESAKSHSSFQLIENELVKEKEKEKEKSTTPSKRERRNTEREKEKEKEKEKEREKEREKEKEKELKEKEKELKEKEKEEYRKHRKETGKGGKAPSLIGSTNNFNPNILLNSTSANNNNSINNINNNPNNNNNGVMKNGYLEYWTGSKWKVRRMILTRERVVIKHSSTDQDSSSRRKSLKQLEILASDITSVRSEFSKDLSWIQKGVKLSDPNEYIIFVVVEKGKNSHFFRFENQREICDWLLSFELLREITPNSRFALDNDEKIFCLETFYNKTHKGGLIKNCINNDYWLYDASKGTLALFNPESPANWHCAWNGRSLVPSLNAPSYIGTGVWDGNSLEWRESSDKNARVLHTYIWLPNDQEFRSVSSVWYWRDNQLFSELSKANWQAYGDIPPILIMLLQLQESS